jgi:hypothetical protein
MGEKACNDSQAFGYTRSYYLVSNFLAVQSQGHNQKLALPKRNFELGVVSSPSAAAYRGLLSLNSDLDKSTTHMRTLMIDLFLKSVHPTSVHLIGGVFHGRVSLRCTSRTCISQACISRACISWACTSRACILRACISWIYTSRVGMCLIGVHLMAMCFMGVHLTGVHLMA